MVLFFLFRLLHRISLFFPILSDSLVPRTALGLADGGGFVFRCSRRLSGWVAMEPTMEDDVEQKKNYDNKKTTERGSFCAE